MEDIPTNADSQESYANIVLVSTIDTWRKKAQISREWNLSVQGGPLYKPKVNTQLEKYIEKGILEKRGSTYYFHPRCDFFRHHLKQYLETKVDDGELSEQSSQVVAAVLEDDGIHDLIRLIDDDRFREKVLSLDNIKALNGGDISSIRSEPFKVFLQPILTAIVPYSKDVIAEGLDGVPGMNSDRVANMVMDMLVGAGFTQVEGIKNGLEDLKDDPKMDVLKDACNAAVNNKLREVMGLG